MNGFAEAVARAEVDADASARARASAACKSLCVDRAKAQRLQLIPREIG
jgi:hypothetical protein